MDAHDTKSCTPDGFFQCYITYRLAKTKQVMSYLTTEQRLSYSTTRAYRN